MNKTDYFKLMTETTYNTKKIIRNSIDSIENTDLKKIIYYFPQYRLDKSSIYLRPLCIRLAYEASGAHDWQNIEYIAAAYELLNISSYQSNLSFDKKGGVTTVKKINDQFIASMIVRELAQKVVSENICKSSFLDDVLKSMSKINLSIYTGQYYDLNELLINKWNNYKTMHEFLEVYLKKCLYLSGTFFEECFSVGALAGGADNKTISALRSFGREFGIGLQIINDLANFTPVGATEKTRFDLYADLKNDRLTLPVYYFLRYGDQGSRCDFLKLRASAHNNNDKYPIMARLIRDNDAAFYAKKMAKVFMKKAKKNLLTLNKVTAVKYLSVMASVLKTNKYLNRLSNHAFKTKTIEDHELQKILDSITINYQMR